MFKRSLVVMFAAALGVFAFVATSSATSTKGGDLPPSVPAHALPVQTLDEATAISLANTIGSEAAGRYGIGPDAVQHVRVLAQSSRGPLYVVAGASGECLVLAFAASCGDVTSGEPVSVFVSDSAGPFAVGGGIGASDHQGVRFVTPSGRNVPAHSVPGGFVITEGDGVNLDSQIVTTGA
jgi:hypothetical protein